MRSLGRAGGAGAAALLALGLVVGAASQAAGQTVIDASTAPRALAANGAVVIMPEVDQLDCDGMSQVLRRIDLSGYRGPAPVPEGHPDVSIFAYEDRLSARFYRQCILRGDRLDDPGTAFSYGFQTQ